MIKFEGTPEENIAYEKGIADERERMLKILKKYHSTFGAGEDVSESTTVMQVKYMYNFIIESRPLK